MLLLILQSCFSEPNPPEVPATNSKPAAPAVEAVHSKPSNGEVVSIGRRLDNNHTLGLKDDGALIEVLDINAQQTSVFGQVDTNGVYTLTDGSKGSIFNPNNFVLSTIPAKGRFAESVVDYGNRSSEADWVQVNLPQVAAKSCTIGILDANPRKDRHEDEIVPGAIKAVAPNATTTRLSYSGATQGVQTNLNDTTKKGFENFAAGLAINFLEQFMAQLHGLLADPTSPRVVNVSNGLSFAKLNMTLWPKIPNDHPWRNLVEQTEDGVSNLLKYSEYLMKVVTQNAQYQAKLKEYQELTKQASLRGKVLVVSCGNNDLQFPAADGAAYNILAMSDYVIAVGAVNSSATAGQHNDDQVSALSAKGAGGYHPTLAAQGDYVGYMANGRQKFESGTSLAAPQVAATVALMIATKSDLTFAQIKKILIETADEGKRLKEVWVGAGILDVQEALNRCNK